MRILFTSTRGDGHIRPLVPYATALAGLGHEILFAAPEECRAVTDKGGFDLASVGRITDDEFRAIWAPHKGVRLEAMMKVAIPEMFAAATARSALPALTATADRWRPDLIVRESMDYAGLVTAMRLGIPHARVNVHNCEVEAISNDLAADPVDRLRADFGMTPDAGRAIWAEPVFTAFPAGFDGDARHGADNPPMRVGAPPVRTGASANWTPRGDRPLVYVTFGTVAAGLGGKGFVFHNALEAMASLEVEALITTGPDFDIDTLGAVPDHVTIRPFVPQAEVFPHASAVLSHGGSGTLVGTLAAGLRQVVAPLLADQPFNSRRVQAQGLGLEVEDPTCEALARAVTEVLDRADIAANARAIAVEIAGLPDHSIAAERIVALA